MLEVRFGKNFPKVIYHYDVDIKPEKKKYLYRKVFDTAIKRLYPGERSIAFDGKKNAYTLKDLSKQAVSIMQIFFYCISMKCLKYLCISYQKFFLEFN